MNTARPSRCAPADLPGSWPVRRSLGIHLVRSLGAVTSPDQLLPLLQSNSARKCMYTSYTRRRGKSFLFVGVRSAKLYGLLLFNTVSGRQQKREPGAVQRCCLAWSQNRWILESEMPHERRAERADRESNRMTNARHHPRPGARPRNRVRTAEGSSWRSVARKMAQPADVRGRLRHRAAAPAGGTRELSQRTS